MTIPIVVEGPVDASTLRALVMISSFGFEVETRPSNGKYLLTEVLATVIKGTKGIVAAAQDLNSATPQDLQQHYRTFLQGQFNNVSDLHENVFKVGDNFVFLIPLGLLGDNDLDGFNISVHMIEDYLVKILLTDDKVVTSLSRSIYRNSNKLKQTLHKFSGILESEGRSFRSSKELIEMSKALFQFSASPATFADEIMKNASTAVVKNVMSDICNLFTLIQEY